jgi:hypothetical protein
MKQLPQTGITFATERDENQSTAFHGNECEQITKS